MLYQKVNRYLSNGYAVIYGVESSYPDNVIKNMARSGIGIKSYVETGALTIIDRNSIYSLQKTQLEGEALFGVWIDIVSDGRRRGQFKGIVVMGMPEPFFETKNHSKLVAYEQFLSKQHFDGSLEAICCYMQNSVKDLLLGHLISLLSSHQYTVEGVEEYRKWHSAKLFVMIVKGLEKTVGKTTATLIFGAMKSMHKIDETTVISQPGVFEQILNKMFADSAEMIVDGIKDEIIKEISLGPNLSKPTDSP